MNYSCEEGSGDEVEKGARRLGAEAFPASMVHGLGRWRQGKRKIMTKALPYREAKEQERVRSTGYKNPNGSNTKRLRNVWQKK